MVCGTPPYYSCFISPPYQRRVKIVKLKQEFTVTVKWSEATERFYSTFSRYVCPRNYHTPGFTTRPAPPYTPSTSDYNISILDPIVIYSKVPSERPNESCPATKKKQEKVGKQKVPGTRRKNLHKSHLTYHQDEHRLLTKVKHIRARNGSTRQPANLSAPHATPAVAHKVSRRAFCATDL